MSGPRAVFGELAAFARYTNGLRSFLREPLSAADCRRMVEERLRARDESFLDVLQAGVFAQPASPYQALLRAAGVEYGDMDVIATALAALAEGPAYKQMMASVWQTGDTLKVVRREPHPTATAKILPLHLVRP